MAPNRPLAPGTAPDRRYLLAADLGTSSLKVALTTARGEIVAGTVEPLRVSLLDGGGAEQDPESWWARFVLATRRLLAETGIPPGAVAGIGVGAQWSGTVAVDAEGRPLMPAVIWMDSRGAEQVRRITGGLLRVQGYSARKLWTWIRRTGGAPGHSGKDSIAHILLIRDRFPEVYRRTHRFLEPKDWMNLRLTGRFASSFDAIALHWVCDIRDPTGVRYDRRLLRWSGLDREKLPDLLPPATVVGTLTPRAAAELGLDERVPVATGMGDVMAAAIGSGAVRDFEPHLYVGTSSWLVCHVPYQRTDLLHNMAFLPAAIPGRYLLANEQESAGLCLSVLKDAILLADDELSSGPGPGQGRSEQEAFAAMLRMAGRVPPGSDGLIFTPWLNGERTPVDDRTVRGGFFNLSLATTRAHLVRAVLEGVAYNSRWLLRHVERFIRRRLEAITMVGGGARSDLWCQIHADVMDRPVRQAADPVMANARGAAFQAAVAVGLLSWEEIPDLVPIARTFRPDPANRATYDRLFKEFLQLYSKNRRIYARLNEDRRSER